MRKFSGIPSKVKADLKKEAPPSKFKARPQTASFGPRDLNYNTLADFDKEMPPAGVEDKLAPEKENTNEMNKPPKTPNFGKIPKYLHKYK